MKRLSPGARRIEREKKGRREGGRERERQRQREAESVLAARRSQEEQKEAGSISRAKAVVALKLHEAQLCQKHVRFWPFRTCLGQESRRSSVSVIVTAI